VGVASSRYSSRCNEALHTSPGDAAVAEYPQIPAGVITGQPGQALTADQAQEIADLPSRTETQVFPKAMPVFSRSDWPLPVSCPALLVVLASA